MSLNGLVLFYLQQIRRIVHNLLLLTINILRAAPNGSSLRGSAAAEWEWEAPGDLA